MNTNRNKGHNYEREVCKLYKDTGFHTRTSRYASKEKDDEKVDLVGTGIFNIQCKATQTLDYHGVLGGMPNDNQINIIHHKLNKKVNGRLKRGRFVILYEEDWMEVVDMLNSNDII